MTAVLAAATDHPFAADLAAWRIDWAHRPEWWYADALAAIARGAYRIIPSRDGRSPYLLRCWLSAAIPATGADQAEVFVSENAVLLHHFLAADDDGALHDHPWDFRTRILSGGYIEALPPTDWTPAAGGPPIAGRLLPRVPGDSIARRASDLHAVAHITPRTWTLVTTGPRVRDWHFHPPGQPPMPWRDFLATKRAPGAAA